MTMQHLDVPALEPTRRAIEITKATYVRFPDVVGMIAVEDAHFIASLLELNDCKTVVELGVAAGASSSIILSGFDGAPGRCALYAFDALGHFYADPTKPIGFIARESGFSSDKGYHTFGERFSYDVARTMFERLPSGGRVDAAFIDAHHGHPWPALDALAILPCMALGGWMLFHDINLAWLIRDGREELGPQFALEAWKGTKVRSPGTHPNVGAVKIEDMSKAVSWLIDALALRWEFSPPAQALRAVMLAASGVMEKTQRERLIDIFVANGHERHFFSATPSLDVASPWFPIARQPWLSEPPVALDTIVTMLHPDELRMLRWLTRDHYSGSGAIIDAGCFLGGSTAALVAGLQAAGKPSKVETYDLFVAEDYAGELYGGTQFKAGDRVRHIFDANIAAFKDAVNVHDGDFLTADVGEGPIEILFIDLAKSGDLNDRVVREFFPRLIPGKSIVVQQDYFWCCPWIHTTMEHLRGKFTYLGNTEFASAVYGLDKPISAEEAAAACFGAMSVEAREGYFVKALSRIHGQKRDVLLASAQGVGLATSIDAVEPRMAVVPAHGQVVFDLGAYDGADIDYYVRKGFRVVGVEASPELVAKLNIRFASEIADGRVTILHRVLWEKADVQIPFFVNETNQEWSSFDAAVARRDPTHSVVELNLLTTTYERLVEEYGVPHFVKSDLEGGDATVCRQVAAANGGRPNFISAELNAGGVVGSLAKAGYDLFQIVDQSRIPGSPAPAGAQEGLPVDMIFPAFSSGAFGRDLAPDRWLGLEDTIAVIHAYHLIWGKAPQLCAPWADVHATTATFLGR